MEITLRAVAFTCGSCRTVYRDALLVGGYGRLVARDCAGRHAAVADLLADPLVDLLGQVAAERAALFGRVSSTAAPDLRRAYLRLCDPSPDGLPYDEDALPACPACGAQPDVQERLEELLRVDLPPLRHDTLDALPSPEQRARVTQALRES